MTRRTQETAQPAELSADEVRVAVSMRELRRGYAMGRFRDRIFGVDGHALDIAQWDALEVLTAQGDARMSDLAAALRVDPSTATRTVARLEAAGLVERAKRGDDGRSVVVAVTATGQELHTRLLARAHEAYGALFARFDAVEISTLAGLMERLVAGVDDLASLPQGTVSD